MSLDQLAPWVFRILSLCLTVISLMSLWFPSTFSLSSSSVKTKSSMRNGSS